MFRRPAAAASGQNRNRSGTPRSLGEIAVAKRGYAPVLMAMVVITAALLRLASQAQSAMPSDSTGGSGEAETVGQTYRAFPL
jgi:hypothetical protein